VNTSTTRFAQCEHRYSMERVEILSDDEL